MPLGVGVLIGVGAAVLLALVLGLPTLRLRRLPGHRHHRRQRDLAAHGQRPAGVLSPAGPTGSAASARGSTTSTRSPAPTRVRALALRERTLYVLLVGWVLVLLATLLVALLIRSPWGRVIKAIREDEDAVRSLGKNVYGYKMQSLILGGVIGPSAARLFWVLPQAASRRQLQPHPHVLRLCGADPGGIARLGAGGRLDDLLGACCRSRRDSSASWSPTSTSPTSWTPTRRATCASCSWARG